MFTYYRHKMSIFFFLEMVKILLILKIYNALKYWHLFMGRATKKISKNQENCIVFAFWLWFFESIWFVMYVICFTFCLQIVCWMLKIRARQLDFVRFRNSHRLNILIVIRRTTVAECFRLKIIGRWKILPKKNNNNFNNTLYPSFII